MGKDGKKIQDRLGTLNQNIYPWTEPQLPIAEIINPVFLADPLGALVGKNLTQLGVWNPKWVGDKTIGQMK